MRQRFLLILAVSFFTFFSVSANPAYTVLMPEYDKDSLKLICFFVDNAKFFDDWTKAELPKIINTNSVNRGDSIFPIILFGTDAVDDAGNASLNYDITIFGPDGSEYESIKDLVIWDEGPANGKYFLMQQQIAIVIEENDPIGIRTVDLLIKENNKNIAVPFSLNFVVEEDDLVNSALDTLSNLREPEDLGLFLQEYYKAPRPDLVPEALVIAFELGLLSDPDANSPIFGFFSVVFSQNKESLKEWKKIGKSHEASKEFIKRIVKASKDPNNTFMKEDIGPGLNDIYWGAYFASGDIYYVRQIVSHLEFTDERLDLTKYLTGATAEWSLCSNATTHPSVKADLILLEKSVESEIATKIKNLLNSVPSDVNQKMQDVYNEQVTNGVW